MGEVLVQRDATFRKVKKSLAKLLRRDEVLDEVVLATKEHGVLLELEDYDPILDVRHVLALNLDLDRSDDPHNVIARKTNTAEQFANLARKTGSVVPKKGTLK